MTPLNWVRLEEATLRNDPFDYIHVADALSGETAARIDAEFPAIRAAGSFSVDDAPPGPALATVIEELRSDRFRALMSRLFQIDLCGLPSMVTLRGMAGARDGFVHTDSRSKVLSLLLYLNPDWASCDGQLRLLRDEHGLDAPAVEIPAHMGSLVVFRRSDTSWHGHTRYDGVRRVLQFNYVTSTKAPVVGELRHRLSALLKGRSPNGLGAAWPGRARHAARAAVAAD